MTATTEKTVRELALENPAAARIFENLKIDYCCGGARTLEAACRAAGVEPERVVAALECAGTGPANARDWNQAPLGELIDHIVTTHHAYTRAAIERIPTLLEKVIAAHGARHPEVEGIRPTFAGMAQELSTHLMKEEMMLFPYVARMEEAVLAGDPVMPAPFGTVQNPVRMMMHEHDGAGDALREMRTATKDYTVPSDACATFRALYAALEELEMDLHQHIHLENNILFPRAIQMER